MTRAVLLFSVMLVGCGAVEGNDDAGVVDAGQMVVDAGVMRRDAGMDVVDAGMECTPDTWSNFGQQFYAQRCNGCHGFTQGQVQSRRAEMISRIETGDMPRGTTLTTAQKDRVLVWLGCGAE